MQHLVRPCAGSGPSRGEPAHLRQRRRAGLRTRGWRERWPGSQTASRALPRRWRPWQYPGAGCEVGRGLSVRSGASRDCPRRHGARSGRDSAGRAAETLPDRGALGRRGASRTAVPRPDPHPARSHPPLGAELRGAAASAGPRPWRPEQAALEDVLLEASSRARPSGHGGCCGRKHRSHASGRDACGRRRPLGPLR